MNELTKFLVEGILNEETEKAVALFAGGFKPPTKGHLEVVKKGIELAKDKHGANVDEINIIVGGGVRDGITQSQSKEIWELYARVFQDQFPIINVIADNPFDYYKDYLRKHPDDQVFVFIGSREGNEDDQADVKFRSEFVKNYSDNVIPLQVPTAAVTSGTEARKYFKKNDIENFKTTLPSGLTTGNIGEIINILNGKSTNSMRKPALKATEPLTPLNEEKMSIDDFNLVGAVLRDKNKSKKIHDLLLQMFPQQKELLDYNYKNDSYAEFKRVIFHIDKYNIEGPKLIQHTKLKLDPEVYKERDKKYEEYAEGKIKKYFRDSDSDPRTLDLSKLPPITIDSGGEVMDGNHRAFLAIKQQKPLKAYQIVDAKNDHPNVEKILNIVGRKKQEENIDPKSQAKHKGKAAPFGSAYEPVNEVNLITGKDFGKDKLKEITPIIFLSHDNFKENEIKKLKKDLDSDPYISSRYAGIVLDLNSFKTNKGFDFNKIVKTGNSITNSLKTQYKNKLSKLDPVVYVTYTPKSKQIKDILGNKFLFLNKLDAGDIVTNSKLQMRRGADEVTARLGKAFDTSGIKKLNENATYSSKIDYKQQIKDLTKHMIKKGMNILPLPRVIFKHGDQENASQFLGKTAYYSPSDMTVVLYTEGRHPKDIVRSFAHEMVHHIQNLEDRLENISTTNTMEDDNLNDIEREAYTRGNMVFRNWTDNMDGEEVSSLNEKIVGEKIECDNCGWSWNIVDGGDDLYMCHKCGHDNEPENGDPFGLKAYARELMEDLNIEDIKPATKSLEEQEEVRIFTTNCGCDKT